MIRYVRPVAARDASGIVAVIYAEVKREFGALVEPMTLHSPAPAILAGVWRACRATLVTGTVARALKEAVATAVSRANRCAYCVDAHVVMLDGAGAHQTADALAAGDVGAIRDPRARALAAWASVGLGRDTAKGVSPHSPPFGADEAPEILGTALMFHYINRPVTVLLGDSPLPAAPAAFKGPLRRAAGWWFARAIARPKATDPAPLVPAAPLPNDLRWAEVSPRVADALARFAAAVDVEGAHVLPATTRQLVTARLAEWDGSDVGLGRQWLAPVLATIDEAQRPAAQLALLAAFAPHQIDDAVVDAFRASVPGDRALVAALAWASLAAARRIVQRLAATS